MTATGPRARSPERPSAMVLSPPLHHRSGSPTRATQQERLWTTEQLLELARRGCPLCLGTGRIIDKTCACVYEQVFRLCYRRYRHCLSSDPRGWRHIDQEYVADFETIARRELSPFDWFHFRRHFVQGVAKPGVEPAVIIRVGRAYANTRPYPLFWPHVYFDEPTHLAPKPERT